MQLSLMTQVLRVLFLTFTSARVLSVTSMTNSGAGDREGFNM